MAAGQVWCVEPLLNGNEKYIRALGTSYAAPLVAGLAAGLWQLFPEKTHQDIADLLRSSGHQVVSPNNEIGYGVPHFSRAQVPAP